MPFVKIDYHEKQYSKEDLSVFSEQIMDALIHEFNVPKEDCFQIFQSRKEEEFYFNPSYLIDRKRTNQLLYIQITCGAGRTIKQKKALYATIAENLYKNGHVAKQNVFIILQETKLEDWSFGMGRAQMIEQTSNVSINRREDGYEA